jgi:hypothetical protein
LNPIPGIGRPMPFPSPFQGEGSEGFKGGAEGMEERGVAKLRIDAKRPYMGESYSKERN